MRLHISNEALFYSIGTLIVFLLSFVLSTLAYIWIPEINYLVFACMISVVFIIFVVIIVLKQKRIKYAPVLLALLIIANSIIFFSFKEKTSQLICSSFGRRPISNLIQEDIIGEQFWFCGSLQSCEVVEHGLNNRYEICLIEDIYDPSIIAIFVNMKLTQSSDSLVQASHDLNSLRLQSKGSFIIRQGVRPNIVHGCSEWTQIILPSSCVLILNTSIQLE